MTDSLTAKTDTWLNAKTMTEVMYCPRAGIIAHESRAPDTGEEIVRAPRLDYLPDFSIEMIEQGLQRTWNSIWLALTWLSPALLVFGLVSYFYEPMLAVLLLPTAWYGGRWLFRKLCDVAELSRRLRSARAVTPVEPDPNSAEPQPVNWWALLAAGFTPVEYAAPHEDPELRFSGRPWRVLHKGSLRIPVFRKRRGRDTIHRQHVARMSGYCHLLESCEGGESPYGIVLFGDGYDGVTVPGTSENRNTFHRELECARRLLDSLSSLRVMPDAPQPQVCAECPLGKPRVYRPGFTDTLSNGVCLPPYRTRGQDKRLYHSTCGDRFQWVPSHNLALEKKLR